MKKTPILQVSLFAEHDVVEQRNSEELSAIPKTPRDLEVLRGGLRVTARVVVCDDDSCSRLTNRRTEHLARMNRRCGQRPARYLGNGEHTMPRVQKERDEHLDRLVLEQRSKHLGHLRWSAGLLAVGARERW